LALQTDLLASYEESSRAWLARVQSEVALWSDLTSKLTATHTVPEAFETYANCISQRMKWPQTTVVYWQTKLKKSH
jgi:hypothetical protein